MTPSASRAAVRSIALILPLEIVAPTIAAYAMSGRKISTCVAGAAHRLFVTVETGDGLADRAGHAA